MNKFHRRSSERKLPSILTIEDLSQLLQKLVADLQAGMESPTPEILNGFIAQMVKAVYVDPGSDGFKIRMRVL